MAGAIAVCPKCGSQLEVKLSFASGPRESSASKAVDSSELKDLLSRINDDDLKGGDLRFVLETRARYEQYGDRTLMSAKQMSWLQSLAERAF